MSLEKAYANLKAMKHRPSDDVGRELATLVIAGLETLNTIEEMQAVINDLKDRVDDLEVEAGIF